MCLSAVMKGDQVAEWTCEPCVKWINHMAPIHNRLGTLNGLLERSRLNAAAYAEDAAEEEEEALEAERERCQLDLELWEHENRDSYGSENEDLPVRLLEAEYVAKEVKMDAEFRRSRADDYEAELAAVQAELDLVRAEYEEEIKSWLERMRTEKAKLLPYAARAKAPPAPRTGDSNAPYAATLPELSGVRCRCLPLLASTFRARRPLSFALLTPPGSAHVDVVDDLRPDPRDYEGKSDPEYRRAQNAWSKREKRRQKLAAAVAAAAAAGGGDGVADTKGHPKPSGPVPKVDIDEVPTPCKWDVLRGCWVHPVDGTMHVVERNKARKAAQRASQAWRGAQSQRIHEEAKRRLKEHQPPRNAESVSGDYLTKVKIDSKSFPMLFRFEALQEVWHKRSRYLAVGRSSIIWRAGGFLEKHIETRGKPKAEYITFRPSRWYWEIAEVLVAECDGITLAQYKHQLRMILRCNAAVLVEHFALVWAAEGEERQRMESEDLPLHAERARQQAEVEARRDKASALREERSLRQFRARLARMQDADARRSIIYTCNGSSELRHRPCHEFNPVPPLDWTDEEVERWHFDLAWDFIACSSCFERRRLAKGRFEEIRAVREAPQLETIGNLTFQCRWKRNLKQGSTQPCMRTFRAAVKPGDFTHEEVMGLPMHGWATCIHSPVNIHPHLQFGYWCRDLVRGTVNCPACWLARERAP